MVNLVYLANIQLKQCLGDRYIPLTLKSEPVVDMPFLSTGRSQLILTQLIRSSTLFEVSVKCFPITSCLKCMVNSYFHLSQKEILADKRINRAQPVLTYHAFQRLLVQNSAGQFL